MPRYILRFTEGRRAWYLEWSTVVDAPITFGMSLDAFRDYYRERYGIEGLKDLPERLKRAREHSTSGIGFATLDELLACNRAGKGESRLSKEEIVDWYCKRQEDPT